MDIVEAVYPPTKDSHLATPPRRLTFPRSNHKRRPNSVHVRVKHVRRSNGASRTRIVLAAKAVDIFRRWNRKRGLVAACRPLKIVKARENARYTNSAR